MKKIWLIFLSSLTLILAGCGGDDDDDTVLIDRQFQIEITNLTHNQPLSPPGAVLHGRDYQAFQAGEPVSIGLEVLAEAGDPQDWLDEATTIDTVMATTAADGPVPPGAATTLTLTAEPNTEPYLSLATMLVNTNDAFAGRSGLSLAQLSVQHSLTLDLSAYDAGTEANSETAATVPGPVAGGEGFNPMRDDADFVAIHGGVVTRDDGLATSVLDESHRFIGPVARVTVTRTQ